MVSFEKEDEMDIRRSSTEGMKWASIIPLIGGSSIGCFKSAGCLPQFHLSYKPFRKNEEHLMKFWPTVPIYYLDDNQEPKNIQGKVFVNVTNKIVRGLPKN